MTNYALIDVRGIAIAFVLFSALTFFPGYLLAYLLNAWGFRTRPFAFQLSASVPLSIGVGPIVTFFAGSFAWPLYICATFAALSILVRTRPVIDKTSRIALLVGLGWSLFAALWLMDWQIGSRVYFPIYALDYSTRAAMVHSLTTFGLPARTPFLNPGHAVALRYHFLWLLQCSLIRGSSRLVFIAGAIWCGLGLMCVSALAMRIFMRQRSWVVIGLLAVTGLDLIPALLLLLANRLHLLGILPPSAEWWNDQVDGFVYTALWEPHYICALIACMTGWLLLWQSRKAASVCVAALCFATAVGAGSFVALVFAVFLAVWMCFHFRESLPVALSGILTIIVSLPYLETLRGPAENVGGGSLLRLTVRAFSPLPLPWVVNLLSLPLNYFLELGFFGVCVLIGYRRRLARQEWMLLTMALCSIVFCTFVKSGATPNNDLGWRGFLVAQFSLLVLAAAYLKDARPNRVLCVLLLIGLGGTAYDLVLTRLFPLLSDMHQVPPLKWLSLSNRSDNKLGERTRANRDAYEWLQKHSAPTAILGQNPDVDAVDLFSGLYADRGILAGDRNCTVGFGGSRSECEGALLPLNLFFQGKTALLSACHTLPADFFVIKDTDPAWHRPAGVPAFANGFVRIYSCASVQRQ